MEKSDDDKGEGLAKPVMMHQMRKHKAKRD